MPDVAVVGSGPNGLAAAVTMARAGLSVQLFEAAGTVGGGIRTAELTLPGYRHDVCAAVHPMALASPFFQAFELGRRIELLVPDVSYAHPLDGGRAGIAHRSLDRTVAGLGPDGPAWRRLMEPLLRRLDGIVDFTQDKLLRLPADPLAVAAFGLRVLAQGTPGWNVGFKSDVVPAMLTGVGAHAIGRLPSLATSGAGLLLGVLAHAGGWPVPAGGSQAIADSLADDLVAHGGEITVSHKVRSIAELKAATGARAVIADVTPRALAAMAGDILPPRYMRSLESFRYGPGVFKVDFALSGPVPWIAPGVGRAPTVHLGGSRAAIAFAESEVLAGRHPENPYVLAVQPSVLDGSRAPAGHHTFWAYTHVPAGSTRDCTEQIIAAVERHAPGFRDLILASRGQTARDMGEYNANYIGGDISSGAVTLGQLLKRPVVSADPWRTPAAGLYLGSASTPPGPAVHGMGGWLAARSALKHSFGLPAPDLGMGA
ncbi:phytoene dehydrogenase-like protein [Arthrobacter stackebrandtii]|uniref:Pyridine nucleotide-disulfide oxidoreductase domain-containing protein 2 n=1 Tax=Arthrobacter stackebrandtii TaxID=272161 RepID=A0ABS4YV98_9MICC|nr:NAD(P)/FAD-dependent oxidoreductase [Arthrobacter stackebrandtii]MBP2412718.1 phytoene dehydrogenase-like protein [Arthrobacter stackebrandtii]PYG99937.1 dehydrogenase [Arthrobacter stackebrandtii]